MQVIAQAAPCGALVHGVDLKRIDRSQDAALRARGLTHQARAQFIYRHRRSGGMLVTWDNRCLVQAATGGYDGQERLLHRIIVAQAAALAIA